MATSLTPEPLTHASSITWKLSLLFFKNLVPSQLSGLTLTAASSETPPWLLSPTPGATLTPPYPSVATLHLYKPVSAAC